MFFFLSALERGPARKFAGSRKHQRGRRSQRRNGQKSLPVAAVFRVDSTLSIKAPVARAY